MLDSRPKLLFLALHFPPFPMRGIRTWAIARYLSRLGWRVTVVTPAPSVWRALENREETEVSIKRDGIERLLTDHSWRCLDPAILNCRNQGMSWALGGVCRTTARWL